jgi:hypothetical protein
LIIEKNIPPICWIETVSPETAEGELKNIYHQVAAPKGNVHYLYQAQSLCPKSIQGHDTLYKSVLHDLESITPLWFLEAVSVYTSELNGCNYAITHHSANMSYLLNDVEKSKNQKKRLPTLNW